MPYGMYISAEGAHAQSERLQVVSNNLANVNTTAFRRDVTVFQARYSEAIQRGLEPPGTGSLDDLGGGVLVQGTAMDCSRGTLRNTGKPTDMAIDGDGYFLIRRGKQDFLTRAGNFLINSNGALVTQDGDPVLAENKQPIVIDPEAGPWSIGPDATMQQDGNLVNMALVRPRHPSDLAKVGDNLYMPLGRTSAVPVGERRVTVGVLESSSVKPTLEMMELIEATRAFEANTSMIRNQDSMLGTLISRLLKEG